MEKDSGNTAFIIEFGKQILPYLSTLFLSSWGGLVAHIEKLRSQARKFTWKELAFDLIISSFAGLLTHFLCEYSHTQGAISAVLIAISGHMGTRALASFERLRDRIFGLPEGNEDAPKQ